MTGLTSTAQNRTPNLVAEPGVIHLCLNGQKKMKED